MGAWYGSKATTGLCQAIVSLMPPRSACLETRLGGGAIMKRKPPAQRGIGLDRRATDGFGRDCPVELRHGCARRFLSGFDFQGREPPCVQSTRRSQRRCRAMPPGERLAVEAG